ncbi:MAG: hypothetical protein PHY08_06355 [Candidatus Cloacimonetes bacterium]|nr:hypothetical protein [Candidatus Cloacimonadota bacterium]MDD4156180.1 hypothetical protein [Candidatus Cloacimonadota bacterium]
MNILKNMSEDLAKKIIGKKENAEIYLIELSKKKAINLQTKIIKSGRKKGEKKLTYSTNDLWKTVVSEWDYNYSLTIIREMFKKTKKYKNGKEADKAMEILLKEWDDLKLGKIDWPFSQGAFDDFVQRINSEKNDGSKKDDKVKNAAVKYRRIKEINTVRNDYIETLIFEKNENILPTLNHRRGVDFFINGESYDQKVAKSPTNEFKKKYRESWKQTALSHPEIVAQYLYQYQDEGRFGSDSRLLIVYIDEDVTVDIIKETIEKFNLNNPYNITFTYKHKNQGEKTYKVSCYIILLYKDH